MPKAPGREGVVKGDGEVEDWVLDERKQTKINMLREGVTFRRDSQRDAKEWERESRSR